MRENKGCSRGGGSRGRKNRVGERKVGGRREGEGEGEDTQLEVVEKDYLLDPAKILTNRSGD